MDRHISSITDLESQLKAGYRIGYDEALALLRTLPEEELYALAHRLRTHYQGKQFETCSIMNARSGRCSEDCKWCAQSKFYHTDIQIYPLIDEPEALAEARHNAAKGVKRFSLVTSGRSLTDREIDKISTIYRQIGSTVHILLCASMGLLNREQLQKLKDSGVERYHCNMETAPSYFKQLCSTHTPEEKIQTIRWAKEVGLSVCSGGIIGMGESEEQRIELAVTLQQIGVDSIPVNVLNPIPGTALENTPPLSDSHILRAMAMMRIINPTADIRLAGGRNRIKHLEKRLLFCGVSASIVGDMLTTAGSKIDADFTFFRSHGFEV